MRRRIHQIMLLTALLAVAAALPEGASAAGWVTGAAVSPPGIVARHPMIAVTRTGERIVAWEQLSSAGSVDGIAVRIAPPGGLFGPAQLIEDPNAAQETLTVGSDGTAALVWVSGTPAFSAIRIARLPAGESSFVAATPWRVNAPVVHRPSAAVTVGDVYVAFDTAQNFNPVVNSTVQVIRLPAGTSDPQSGNGGSSLAQETYNPAPPFNQPPRRVLEPTIAVQGDVVHVLWERTVDAGAGPTSFTEIRHATRLFTSFLFLDQPSVATFSPASTVAPEVHPLIAAGAGKVAAVWTAMPPSSLAARDVTGGPVTSVATDGPPGDVHAGLGPDGGLLLGWDRLSAAGPSAAAFATPVPPDGFAAPVAPLVPADSSQLIDDLALGADGSAVAVVDRSTPTGSLGADEQVQASFRAPGAAFGSLEEVSGRQAHGVGGAGGAGGPDPATAAIGPGDDVLIAWSADDRSGIANQRIFVSERDATPPTISSVAVPSRATVGQAVPMSAQATDALSPAQIDWNLGDGSTVTGPSVVHTYRAPGSYTVTVRARDAAGNVSTLSRTVTVTPPTGGGTTDTTPPVITGFRVANARFRVARAATAVLGARRRTPIGTTFTLQVSERSVVSLALVGRLPGRKLGTRCVTGRTRGRRCVAVVSLGPIVRTGRGPGRTTIPFSGRIGRKALAPGSYTVVAVATDQAGNRSRSKSATFTIVTR